MSDKTRIGGWGAANGSLMGVVWMTALLVALSLGLGCGKEQQVYQEPEVKPVRLVKMEATEMTLPREFPGTVKAADTVDLSFRVSGQIMEFPVRVGMEVQEGDLIAKIDPTDYENTLKDITGRLEEERARLAAMKAGARPEDYRALEAAVQATEAEMKRAKVELNRYDQLLTDGVASQAEYDQKDAEYEVALGRYRAAAEDFEIGKVGAREEDIQAQEAKIMSLEAQRKQAADDVAYTELKAPFTGLVARKFVDNFQVVQAQEDIIRLQNTSSVDIDIYLSERDIARTGGQSSIQDYLEDDITALVEFIGLPGREFVARLRQFETEADPETQTYRITFRMEQPAQMDPPVEFVVRPGMNATVRGSKKPVTEGEADYYIPSDAIFADEAGEKMVWVVDPDSKAVSKRAVKTGGQMVGDQIQIVEGLEPGDTVAVTAVSFLNEGDKVTQMADLKKL